MNTKVRVGVVGTGKMGELHLQKYLTLPHVEIAGIFEPNEKRAEHLKNQYGVPVFLNLSELFFESDAVSVTSTTATHFSNCRQALEAGVHVLVEKPMCDDIDQATELIRMAEEKKLMLQVGYLERFRLSRLSRLVPTQELKLIEARWFATQLPRESGIDVVGDMLVHPLDMVLSLCHEEPVEIRVSGFPLVSADLDLFETRLEFSSGLVATLFVNRVAQHKERRMTLFTSQGTATLNFLTNHIDVVRVSNGEVERTQLESSGSDTDVLKTQLEDFVHCVRSNKSPLVSAHDGLRVLKTIKRLRQAFEGFSLGRVPQRPSGELHVS